MFLALYKHIDHRAASAFSYQWPSLICEHSAQNRRRGRHMSVFLSPILTTPKDHGILLSSQSSKFAEYAHMFVLPLYIHKYCVALRAPTLSSGFPISPLLIQIYPGLQNMRNISGIMTKLKPHAYAFFCLAEHERSYALDISTIFSKLSRADRCFLDLCWPSKLTRILSKLFSFNVFLKEWPR